MAESDVPSVHVDVVSDVVCPWCYIGKRRLEMAVALTPEIAVEVNWRPYFLNQWIPREGIDRQTYLETKFGSAERYAAIAERVAAAAAIEGLPFAIDKISRQPNTLDCHRLILWSRSATDPGVMKQRLMELYFAEGADLSDPKTLIRVAVDCGMDGDLVRRLLASDADVQTAPGKPASTACRALSSAAASSSPAPSHRNISPTPSSASPDNTRGYGHKHGNAGRGAGSAACRCTRPQGLLRAGTYPTGTGRACVRA